MKHQHVQPLGNRRRARRAVRPTEVILRDEAISMDEGSVEARLFENCGTGRGLDMLDSLVHIMDILEPYDAEIPLLSVSNEATRCDALRSDALRSDAL